MCFFFSSRRRHTRCALVTGVRRVLFRSARLKDRLDKPAIVIGRDGKASCRAVDGFDIGGAVIAAKDAGILIAGGGHAAAAGLTIDPARIDELRAFMNARIEGFEAPPTGVDMVVECGMLTPDLVESMALLAPFGRGNPEPRIVVVGGFCRKVRILKNAHVKAFLTGPTGEVELILFKGVGSPVGDAIQRAEGRSEEHTSELQSRLRNSF